MTLSIIPTSKRERPILRRLLELYMYDFSEFDHADIGPLGLYNYFYLDQYFTDPNRHPFLVRVNDHWAGFVLVTHHNYLTLELDTWVIGEFFIMRKYRRQGFGEAVACQIFDRFPGPWQVGQIQANTPAIAFWRKVVAHYTGGQYLEHLLNDNRWYGPVQAFYSPSGSGPIQEDSWPFR